MTTRTAGPDNYLGLVNRETGLVDRRVFGDPSIYEMEMERIFARAWLFMCHESQIPNPGDFFLTFMGEDRVIVVRDKDMQVQVMINSCRHRGNAVCRAEEGHATSFMCTYHGWTYDLKGDLVGVPGFKEVYHEDLNREEWGLIKAAQVDGYKGFIFATLDPNAPPLDEYLGGAGRLCMDYMALSGANQIVGGIQKYTIPCNWKFATDNAWDFYHGITTHVSAYLTAYWRPTARELDSGARYAERHFVFPGEYGHIRAGPARVQNRNGDRTDTARGVEPWRTTPEALRELGPVGVQAGGLANVFPNMWITGSQVWLRLPKGPAKTELWSFLILDRDLPPEKRRQSVIHASHGFGPAGFWEQDDGENWAESTRGMVGAISKRFPLNYAMKLGEGQIINEGNQPAYIETKVNEHAQLWFYLSWSEWMTARDWHELRDIHSVPEGTL